MVIITDANGNIQSPTIPENVYQGSNNANQIIFLSPLPQSDSATITFRLPDGTITTENFMTPYTDVPNDYDLNAWFYNLDETLTAKYGTVTYQIKLTNSQGQRVATVGNTFAVLRGVAPLPSETPTATIYEQILEYLSYFQSDILENGWIESKGILPYDATFTYSIGTSVFDKTTKAIYTSKTNNNQGNTLSNTTYWDKTDIVTSGDIDDLLAEKVDKQQTFNITNGTQTNNIKNISSGVELDVILNLGTQTNKTAINLDGINTSLKTSNEANASETSKELKLTKDSVKIYTVESNVSDGGYDIATSKEITELENSKQDKLTAGNNITISAQNVISSGVENNYSSSQETPYSANYINSNFVPLTFASRIYLSKDTSTTANLVNTPPTPSASNLLTTITTNTSFDWSTPMITLTRTLEQAITINATNSFAVDLYFNASRQVTVTFGAKIKVSTDNGSTWTYISNNQDFGAKGYINGLNSEDFVVYTDLLATPTNYAIGTLLAIEIFTKQANAGSLTLDYYCGVTENTADIYSFIEFNFANVNINTNQIENGAVTYPKLSNDVQQKIETSKFYYCVYGTTTYALIQTALANGLIPICLYNGYWYLYSTTLLTNHIFTTIIGNESGGVQVSNADVWTNSIKTLEQTSNKVTSISNLSTDTQYPSAKCVYDLVGDINTLLVALNSGSGV